MTIDFDLSQHLSPHLYRQLQDYQQRHGYPTLIAALDDVLQHFLAQSEEHTSALMSQELQQQVDSLENRVYALTREIMSVRQSVPDQCDRLREQLAAVRLSHSGLLENLRQRMEALEEQTGIAAAEPLLLETPPPASDS